MKLHPMWQAYPALQNDLSESLQLMEQSLKLKNKAVEQAILAMIHSGARCSARPISCCSLNSEREILKSSSTIRSDRNAPYCFTDS